MDWYKRWIGDYGRDTKPLTMLQHGAYNQLLDAYYASEEPLPQDEAELFRMVVAFDPSEQEAVRVVLQKHWRKTRKGWVNNRACKEIDAYRSMCERNRENAASGHATRTATRIPTRGAKTPAKKVRNQKPESSNQSTNESVEPPKGSRQVRKRTKPGTQGKSTETWNAYASAYAERYEVAPRRNATVSSQLVQFVKRVGEEDAPLIARFYLTIDNPFYTSRMHPVDLLLHDSQKITTLWQTDMEDPANVQRRNAGPQRETKEYYADVVNRVSENFRRKQAARSRENDGGTGPPLGLHQE